MGNDQLMRETAIASFSNGVFASINTVFDIPIPENYAMELHYVDFLFSVGANPVTNRIKMQLCDDPDETVVVGHSDEKIIQSTEFLLDTDAQSIGTIQTLDCHKTLLVQNPNFLADLDVDPAADFHTYARIWFNFVKISPREILDLLRQQQY